MPAAPTASSVDCPTANIPFEKNTHRENIQKMKTYLLRIHLDHPQAIRIGKLGTFLFAKGDYWYVGSAKRNLKQRVARHLCKEKKLHWHIDYLLQHAEITSIWCTNISEETLARSLSEKMDTPVSGFGSSDKRTRAHLFSGEEDDCFTAVRSLKLMPLLES